jgi:hypothetical protein
MFALASRQYKQKKRADKYREPFILDLIKAVDDPMWRRIAERDERERQQAN